MVIRRFGDWTMWWLEHMVIRRFGDWKMWWLEHMVIRRFGDWKDWPTRRSVIGIYRGWKRDPHRGGGGSYSGKLVFWWVGPTCRGRGFIFFYQLFIENNCITYLQFSCGYIETWRSSSRAREDDWAVPIFVLLEYNTHTRNSTKKQQKENTIGTGSGYWPNNNETRKNKQT